MSNVRRIEDYSKVLAVEGYSDLLFYAELLEHLGKHDEVFIKHFNGASDLMAKLEAFLSPGLLAVKSAVGVVVDADSDAQARIQSLSQALQNVSGQSLQHGTWFQRQPNLASLGFFVVPDGQQSGEIETLAWNAWANDPQNKSPRQCVDEYLECMSGLGHVPDSPDKGKISTLLAVKNDEDPRLGPGARRGHVFDFTRPEFEPLLDFLSGL